MADSNQLRRNILMGLVLVLVTLAVYWPAISFEFINYDDNFYVTGNTHLSSGFTAENLAWAFTSGYASNWHPLTWLSHILDYQIYGLNPAGHHLTSLLFHAANALLLFGLLLQLTGKPWRSAFVAALFAWHPMHVESVAWVAERKDVLSAFFGLLTLLAYVKYARESKIKNAKFKVYYALALLCFALGLMSKPMLVTLPLILLLLDYWPLNRMGEANQGSRLGRCVWEKAPFFVLAGVSSVITYQVQKSGGAMMLGYLPVGERVANALVAYVDYMGKLVWPRDMAVLYPYNHALPRWEVIGAGMALALVSVVVLCAARRRPYLSVGWLWYVIMLVPVIGLVQVGEQSMADRYTYLPATGLFLLVVWEVTERVGGWRGSGWVLGLAGTVVLGVCLVITSRQLRYWQNSITLFTHALQVTPDNATPHDNLGGALNAQGKYEDAIAQFTQALKLRPGWDMAHNNLGLALLGEGKFEEAITNFQTAIKLKPDYSDAFINLGIALARQGKPGEAVLQYRNALKISPSADAENRLGGVLESQGKLEEAYHHYAAALSLKPDFVEAHVNLAAILNAQGKFEAAREHLLTALKIKPDLAAAHYHLGNALAGLGEPDPAAAQYLAALQLQPADAQTQFNLANLLARQKQWDSAMQHYSGALQLRPDLAQAHVNLALILSRHGRAAEAIDHYRSALRTDPRAITALDNLAWILATNPDPKLRDGAEAVRLSTLATQLTGATDAMAWDTQAAACAEAGQFAESVSAAKKAIELAKTSQNKELVAQIQSRLQLYEAGRAFHESPVGPE